jgi:nucleoside 2-deoxyribosyltransferase
MTLVVRVRVTRAFMNHPGYRASARVWSSAVPTPQLESSLPRPSIYLASPLGFADSTRPFMAALIEQLAVHVDILNPWDDQRFAAEFIRLESENDFRVKQAALHRINTELGRSNAANIDRADGLFAILDGVDVDSGTAAEIGYAFARGKSIFGLRTDFRLAADNHGSIVNLQVEYFIEASGGRIVRTASELVECASSTVHRNGG